MKDADYFRRLSAEQRDYDMACVEADLKRHQQHISKLRDQWRREEGWASRLQTKMTASAYSGSVEHTLTEDQMEVMTSLGFDVTPECLDGENEHLCVISWD